MDLGGRVLCVWAILTLRKIKNRSAFPADRLIRKRPRIDEPVGDSGNVSTVSTFGCHRKPGGGVDIGLVMHRITPNKLTGILVLSPPPAFPVLA